MTAFVLDASVTLSWFFEDEVSDAADLLLARLAAEPAMVPQIWHYEVANAMSIAERRGRVTKARSTQFIAELNALKIDIDADGIERVLGGVLEVARVQSLTAYDAAYLELAMRLGVPLASKDAALCDAAERVGIEVLRAM